MASMRYGRHAPEFILLFLAEETGCGMDLYKKFEQLIPISKFDSAIVYRSLAKLEKEELVEFEWDTSGKGPAKKMYRITGNGLDRLAEHKGFVELRIKNLGIFLDKFSKLEKGGRFK